MNRAKQAYDAEKRANTKIEYFRKHIKEGLEIEKPDLVEDYKSESSD